MIRHNLLPFKSNECWGNPKQTYAVVDKDNNVLEWFKGKVAAQRFLDTKNKLHFYQLKLKTYKELENEK